MPRDSFATRRKAVALALFVSTALSSTVAIQSAAAQTVDADHINAFIRSEYMLCDARLVGALWGIGIEKGKAVIGYNILRGLPANIGQILEESRAAGNHCQLADTGLASRDIEQLAQVWGVSTQQAKLMAVDHFTMGRSAIVKNALGS